MKTTTYNGYFKQTALHLLCGLLPCLCFAQHRSISDASKIANNYVQNNLTALSKSGVSLRLSSSIISSSGKLEKDKEAYYIFTSASDGTGFVVVSGDERMPDILAYSEQGDFDIGNIPPNVRYWFDCYEEAFLTLDNSKTLESIRLESVNPNGVTPLLGNNAWGQGDPYNRLCPLVRNDRCVTGCVATAMAQVMKYHRYPNVGKGNVNYYSSTNKIHLQKDFSAVRFQWDKMLDVYNRNFTQEQADAVSELMFACGTSVKMDYCTSEQGGSGAYQTDLITAFVENFSYDDDAAFMDRRYCSVEDWHQLIIDELNAGRPVNYAGQSMRDGGHSFVFDGYKESSGSKYPYYHVNWGWNGDCDGFYQIAELHPIENGQHATFAGFNSSQQMTIGIKPEDGIDDGIAYLCTPTLHVSSPSTKVGSNLKVYTASCVNFSYKPFSGVLRVALISMEDGSETILGEGRIKSLGYLQEQSNLSIEITLPSFLPDGQYTIQLRSKQSEKNNFQQVISKQYPILTILSTDDVVPENTNEALLGSSELEVLSNSDPSLICLNIYELQNMLDSPFIGDLKMILADKSGNQLCSFGDSVQPGELSTFEVQEKPLKIQGKLIGEWPDGDYKLYVGARQINTSKFVYVSFFDITQPDMSYHELSLSAQIKDRKLLVNGKSFNITSSLNQIVANSTIDNDDGIHFYHLDGRYLGMYNKVKMKLQPGFYIVRRGKHIRKISIN